MQVHFHVQQALGDVRKEGHRRQPGGPRRSQRVQPGELDQVQIVLPHPDVEALRLERPVTDPPHERMTVLRLPDRVGRAPQLDAQRDGCGGFAHQRIVAAPHAAPK